MSDPPAGVDQAAWARGIEHARQARSLAVVELGDMAASLEGSRKVDDIVKRSGARWLLGQYQAQASAEASLH